jgi:hypothetical protein
MTLLLPHRHFGVTRYLLHGPRLLCYERILLRSKDSHLIFKTIHLIGKWHFLPRPRPMPRLEFHRLAVDRIVLGWADVNEGRGLYFVSHYALAFS